MVRLLLDGQPETMQYIRSQAGWHYYHLIRDGKPVAEHSVPIILGEDRKFGMFTGGHHYRSMNWEN